MKYLGFSPDYEPIMFIDAFNGQSLLPWESCSTWEKFRTLMQMQYSASAGRSFVERGEYDIINEESGALLGVQDWRKTIKPGMLLSMAIVLREETEKDENDYTCPVCKTQYAGPVGSSTGHTLERVK
ncbi:hypothetical protein DFP73DRAFT_362752 [Morchella snyderi]|nr:hypothetical protein DFP73DRAFT_362752 [Morchella snyderi]